jgi:catechol 2,3-dioxygenase-like lactoylglutathione lyase family enzyme
MEDQKTMMENFERGRISRRQLVQGLVLAGIPLAIAKRSLADTPPFKPVRVSHHTYVAPDLAMTRDWYIEVFGMQLGHQNANSAHLWYGDQSGNTLMIVRQAAAGEESPRIERFAFAIENFNKKAVEAELKRRNLKVTAEDSGVRFNDLDGNAVGIFAVDFMKRPAPSNEKPKLWKAISANHIVADSNYYRKLGDWYKDLFVLRETRDSGRDVYQWFGDTVWIPTQIRQGQKTSPELKSLDHVALTIETYNSPEVEAELKRRGMIKPDAKVNGSLGIDCIDLNGFKNQVCDKDLVPNAEKRAVQQGAKKD